MRMCVIYKRLNIFCLLLFGTTLRNRSASANCISGEECYFEGSPIRLNWSLAQQLCKEMNSALPVIRNAGQQKRLQEHITKTYPRSQHTSTWTSGKKIINQGWTWINGQPMTNLDAFKCVENGSSQESHFLLNTRQLKEGLKLKAEKPHLSAWYICQYIDSRCRDSDTVNLTNSCIKFKGYGNTSWYNAGNKCLAEGGNLAILVGKDPQLLLHYVQSNASHFNARYNFWIGLHKEISWQWHFDEEERNEYITYNNWQSSLPASGDCISIRWPNGLWTFSNCSENKTVICQRENGWKVQATPTRELPEDSPSTATTDVIYIVVIALCIVIIIVIVVVICLVRRKRKSTDEMNHLRYIKRQESSTPRSPETNGHTNHTQSGSEGQVRDITRPNEIPPSAPQIYAEIAPTSIPNDAANKGVLYASLDFAKNEEVTYAEPMKKKPSTETAETEKTKAEAQHKIGPMGDVYALPITNPSSPGTKPTEPRVYANLGV